MKKLDWKSFLFGAALGVAPIAAVAVLSLTSSEATAQLWGRRGARRSRRLFGNGRRRRREAVGERGVPGLFVAVDARFRRFLGRRRA